MGDSSTKTITVGSPGAREVRLPLELRVAVSKADRDDLTSLLAGQHTLEDVVRWGLSRTPPRLIADLVIMDEYNHDVVIAYNKQLYLVYDTT